MTECLMSRKLSEGHRFHFFLNCRDAKLKFIWTTNYEFKSKGSLVNGYLSTVAQHDFSNIVHHWDTKKSCP